MYYTQRMACSAIYSHHRANTVAHRIACRAAFTQQNLRLYGCCPQEVFMQICFADSRLQAVFSQQFNDCSVAGWGSRFPHPPVAIGNKLQQLLSPPVFYRRGYEMRGQGLPVIAQGR